MFANRYFAPRYFPTRYFGHGGAATVLGGYFGHRYFGARYFGPRYFSPRAAVVAIRGGYFGHHYFPIPYFGPRYFSPYGSTVLTPPTPPVVPPAVDNVGSLPPQFLFDLGLRRQQLEEDEIMVLILAGWTATKGPQ